MVIEITTRTGDRGYVQVRASATIAPDVWRISPRQEQRVLRELGAPVGDGLLSGRYVAMREDRGDNIPMVMAPTHDRAFGYSAGIIVRDSRR